jgi:uroporphyrinogen-III synthase
VRQVVITRNPQDAADTAAQVAAFGFTPVIAPLFDIRPVDYSLPLPPFDALIATSRYSLLNLAKADFNILQDYPLFTVGPATTEYAIHCGFKTIHQGSGDARRLAELIFHHIKASSRLLFLTGEPRRPELESTLARHFDLEVCTTYHSVDRHQFPPEALALIIDPKPIWLHFSSKSAERAAKLLCEAPQKHIFQNGLHIALSPAIAAKLSQLGALHCVSAEHQNKESLLALLKQNTRQMA